jgi:hypothetical protein
MNTNQLANLVGSVIQALLGALVTKGIISGSESETIGGAVAALIVFGLTHNWHSSTPPKSGGGAVSVFLAVALVGFSCVGCSGLNRQAFNAENAAAVTADAGMRSYAVYWEKAWQDTNAFHTTHEKLLSQRQDLENISVKIGGGIALVESLRTSYATNAAVESQLRAAVASLADNTGQIVPYINSFLTVTNK